MSRSCRSSIGLGSRSAGARTWRHFRGPTRSSTGPCSSGVRSSACGSPRRSPTGPPWDRSPPASGAWRSPEDGELVVAGSRVRSEADGQAVIAPWTEMIYYGRQQNGYHGGVSPQEMVCPLVLLRDRSSACSGLYPCEYPKPEWWSPAPTATASVEKADVTLTVSRGQGSLFDHIPVEVETPAPPVQ